MEKQAAIKIIKDTFENPFEKGQFINLSKNLVKYLDSSKNFSYQGNTIPKAYQDYVSSMERIGQYSDPDNKKIDALIIRLKKATSLEHARTRQRNFVAWYLNGSRDFKDAALVAFVSPENKDWRFSLVKMEYNLPAPGKVETELTPARRYSFLVGENESSHTAQIQLLPILEDDEKKPKLSDFEQAFNIEVVTREFFTKYRELFHKVEEVLEKLVEQNKRIRDDFEMKGVDTVNFAKKLLGQIVFLYFLQKKGWFGVGRDEDWGTGPKDFLRRLFEKMSVPYSNFFNDVLEPLFYEALAVERTDDFYSRFNCKIPFLNGGLFDPINNYDWVHTDILLPNELFSNNEKTKEGDAGTGILDVFDRYNFTVKEDEPLDKEVAVDPEMLGKVFENLLEVKDRKSRGTYYTPREIVHYMCQESLINYLDTAINTGDIPLVATPPPQGKLFGKPDPEQAALKAPGYRVIVPREDIEALVRTGELAIEHDTRVETYGKETERYSYKLPESIRGNAKLIDDKLANIRVCDPAIGSGAFPVGIMTEIVRARNTLSTYLPKEESRNNYHFKRHAIQNCLYGADLDTGAVEIAKLRLWLSLVVDEEDIKQIQPLPNLDYKIVCGNSLLGMEKNLFNFDLFNDLERLKPLYFSETNAKKKQEFRKQIDQLIKNLTNNKEVFDFAVYFSEVFHEKGGFDVVIANPPYIRQEQLKELKPELQKKFQCYEGTADIYVYFYERGLQILRENATLTFISSNKYFRAAYGKKLRGFLANNCQVCRIIDFGDAPVFEAIAYPSVIVLKNTRPQANHVNIFNWQPGRPLAEFASVVRSGSSQMAQKELTIDGWRLESPAVLRLLEKLRKAGKPLGEFVKGRFYRGIVTGLNEAFVVDHATRDRLVAEHPSSGELLKPFLRGKDIKRWRVEPPDLWLIFTRHGVDIKKYPAIQRHLAQYKRQLMPGTEAGRKPGSYEWYEIQDNIAYWTEFEEPKIVWGNLAVEPKFAFATAGFYVNAPANVIVSDSRYLLGVLNSQITRYLVSQSAAERQGGYLEYKPMYISPLAIPAQPDNECISGLVNTILSAKAKDPEADVSALERQIDQMVYELYGLTQEEIAVVESSNKR
jgi:type I restriction-modification system DNA methylase subunit